MTSYYYPPGQEPPPPTEGNQLPGGPVAGRRRRQSGGGQRSQYGYQNFSNFAQNVQAQPNQYEQDVLSGKYLDINNNPYVKGYTQALTSDWEKALNKGLSAVSSPFLSGSTLGQTGMHGATRAGYAGESQRGLTNELAKGYFGLYGQERGSQDATNQALSGRTNQLVSSAGSAYGADRQLQGVRVQANSALQQAKMAQALGYDQLAAQMMFQYEQLNQQAVDMERLLAGGYGNLVGQYLGGFGEQTGTQTQQGPKQSSLGGFLQGAAGGALTGAGIGNLFGGGGGQQSFFNNNPAGQYWGNNPWGTG
jgi:hypothetical protein